MRRRDDSHARFPKRKPQPRPDPRLHPLHLSAGLPEGEVSEQQIIDHPWLQRLRQIHQLQTAWWVFPTAEHTRFQHVLGAMHLASRAVAALYDSLREVCPDVPSRGYVESLMRLAALLHDVGHGPFGHFFDEHFLADYGLNHEILGSEIIRHELADLLRRVRRNPNGRLADRRNARSRADRLPHHPARRPATPPSAPQWLRFLRSLFSGLYTVDNMDFVLRDAYMSGYSTRAFDLDRLLHYSFFTAKRADDPRARALGPGAVHRRPRRAVPRDLLPPHGAGDRPACRSCSSTASGTCFPATRWSTSTSTSG